MRIAIIGSGNVGSALAAAATKAGHGHPLRLGGRERPRGRRQGRRPGGRQQCGRGP